LQLEDVILGEAAGMHTRETVLANYNDPTAQKVAAENFAKTGQTEPDEAAAGDMAGQAKLLRVQTGRRGGYGQAFQADKAETPLDTMAGLVLGSPDFQKR